MSERALEVAQESGLIHEGEPLLVMLSGGADSVCLLDVALRIGARVSALHVNHGLRPEAAEDEAFCRDLCERMGVPLALERLELASAHRPGNLQAEARDARYSLAERHAGGNYYAAAHTATDQAETLLYRLAVSPGRRALLGMPARRGRLVRPLLEATREETRSYCEARGLEWRDDPSNEDLRFSRARVRHEVMPALRELNPALERTLGETLQLLRDEHEALEHVVDGVVEELGGTALATAELRRRPPALARLVLRRAADAAAAAAGRPEVALSRADADAILGAGSGGTRSYDLGGGLRCVVEYGIARFTYAGGAEAPQPVRLPVPGAVRFGGWEVEARLGPGGEATVDAGALGHHALVRGWRDGDRMRPAGLGGTKTLQDLFTDNKVPRELRRALPLVEVDGEIAWVAGVALAEGFSAGSGDVVSLTARLAHG